jgi:O-antigen ligase
MMLVSAGLLLTLTTQPESVSALHKAAPVIIFVVCAAVALFTNNVRRLTIGIVDITLVLIVLVSVIRSLVTGNDSSFGYTIVFAITIAALSIVVRALTLTELLRVYQGTALLAIALTITINFTELLISLSVEVTRSGLTRFSPLEMHPNLTGLVFGGCAFLCFTLIFEDRSRVWRVLGGVFAALGLVLVVAASARASLVALLVTLAIYALTYARRNPWTLLFFSIAAVFIPIILAVTNAGELLYNILEIDSTSRGVDSNGSGRIELWAAGIELLMDDPFRMMFGGGLRSANVELIGFYTESSYITLVLECGLVLGLAYALVVAYGALYSLRRGRADDHSATLPYTFRCLALFLVYVLVQSIFNRYLLGIGNLASLQVMLILLALSARSHDSLKGEDVPEGPATYERHLWT